MSAFDCVKGILDERDQGKKRKLSKKDRAAVAEIADRPRMLVRSLPEYEVTLSPYMEALMKVGGFSNERAKDDAFNAKRIASSV